MTYDPGPPTTFADVFDAIVDNISTVLHGKRHSVELAVIALLSEGHLLIEDVPGVGKTSLAKALAATIKCSWNRIQFTPDLLPSDLLGVTIFDKLTNEFNFQPGPVFANIVLADEINRASPKAQSALLEAMEERQVSADGTTHPLPTPFMVIATQNPVEQEGTYRLPESQLDRFVMRLSLGYPSREAERTILERHDKPGTTAPLEPVVGAGDVVRMAAHARATYLAPQLKDYLIDIADASRRHPAIELGLSPRATLQLASATRVRATARGADYATPDDVKAVAPAVLGHRLVLTSRSTAVASGDEMVHQLLAEVPVPTPS